MKNAEKNSQDGRGSSMRERKKRNFSSRQLYRPEPPQTPGRAGSAHPTLTLASVSGHHQSAAPSGLLLALSPPHPPPLPHAAHFPTPFFSIPLVSLPSPLPLHVTPPPSHLSPAPPTHPLSGALRRRSSFAARRLLFLKDLDFIFFFQIYAFVPPFP